MSKKSKTLSIKFQISEKPSHLLSWLLYAELLRISKIIRSARLCSWDKGDTSDNSQMSPIVPKKLRDE